MNKRSEVSLEIAADAASVFAALTESSALEGWFAEHAEVSRESGRFAFWGKYTPGNPDREEGGGRLLGWKQDAELSFEWRARGVPGVVSLTLAPTSAGTLVTARHEYQQQDGSDVYLDGAWSLALLNLRSWVETGNEALRPDYSAVPSGELRLTVEAQATPATVFNALLDPALLSRWMMAASPTVEPEIGGTYDLGWPKGDGRPLKITDIAQDSRLAYSWDDRQAPATVVSWELEGSDGATRITLIHSGFEDSIRLDDYFGGWADFLVRLVGLCEGGPNWTAPAWSASQDVAEAQK